MVDPPVMVTLVHGTILFNRIYTREARWIQPGQPVYAALSAAGCTVAPFKWSGGNSHRARAQAAEQLAGHLRQQAASQPGARQCVVAHSHGGNVALHAVHRLRDAGTAVGAVQVITLATPFIHARERTVSRWLVFVAALFGLPTAVIAVAAPVFGPHSFMEWLVVPIGALFVVFLMLCLVGAAMHGQPYRRRDRARFVTSIHAPSVEAGELVAVRAAGDEASGVLVSGQFLAAVQRGLPVSGPAAHGPEHQTRCIEPCPHQRPAQRVHRLGQHLPGRRLHRHRPHPDRQGTPMIRVLIADDERLVRAGLRRILESDGGISIVAEAGDGADAVSAASRCRPDVALLDVRMPRVDGLAAAALIAATPDAPKVVMLTTFDLDEYVHRALRAGAVGFLLKDTPPRDLTAAIHTVCAGHAMLAPTVTRRLIDYFTEHGPGQSTAARERLSVLSYRELQVVRAVAHGLSNADIGERLAMTEATVKTHVSRAMAKLGLTNRVHVAILARDAGLV